MPNENDRPEEGSGATSCRELRVLAMPDPLQLALFASEFSDVIVFRTPPPVVQRVIFGALAPIARRRGYRATYPQISRTALAPRA